MVMAYIVFGLIVSTLSITGVLGIVKPTFKHTFSTREIAGAAVSTTMMQGIHCGLLSSETDMGPTPNAAATMSVSYPVRQGLVQTMSVYLDTWVVYTITAVTILLSDPAFGGDAEGIALTQAVLSAQMGT